MQHHTRVVLLIMIAFGWGVGGSVAAQESLPSENSESPTSIEQLPQRERPTWRFETANDIVFGDDNQFTNGFTFQKHSTVSSDLNNLQGVRAFGKRLAHRLLPKGDDLFYRKALVIGQNMATPEDLENPDIILDDTPYLGYLGVESSWIAYNDERFTGFGITAGIVGEYSGAEQVQKAVHSLIDATDPQGWDHQLDNELGLNFFYMKKRKLWNKPSFDGALSFDVAAGNLLTGVDASLEMRFGRKPGGFAYVYDPLGRNMSYDATLPREDGQTEFYGTLTLRAWAWAVFLPMEGNILTSGNEWTDNNIIEPENVIGQAIIGFHYVRPAWGIHATWTFATDNVDPDSLSPGVDVANFFGALNFEWRF